jgi:hypothetical protein
LNDLIYDILPTLKGVGWSRLLDARELRSEDRMAVVATGRLKGGHVEEGFDPDAIVKQLKRDYPDGLGSVTVDGLEMLYYGPGVQENRSAYPEPVVYKFVKQD